MPILSSFSRLKLAKRVDENKIFLELDKEAWIFDVEKNKSLIYEARGEFLKDFFAPFDEILKGLSNSKIANVCMINNDKIIKFSLEKQNSYKLENFELIFEFTGKNTNAIICQNGFIIQALRLVNSPIHTINLKTKYIPPPAPNFKFNDFLITNIRQDLAQMAQEKYVTELTKLKQTAIKTIEKKLNLTKQRLKNLENKEALKNSSQLTKKTAQKIIENLHLIHSIQDLKRLIGDNFTPKMPPSKLANELFNTAKKDMQKAQNIFLQEDSLLQKKAFLENLQETISLATDEATIKTLLPKKKKEKKSTPTSLIESFVGEHKIFVGMNQNANKKVLSLAKANDFWFHVQGLPSSHLLLRCAKKTPTKDEILKAARLCLMFSGCKNDKFCVDYTHRRFVKQAQDAKVLYTNYKTISLDLRS